MNLFQPSCTWVYHAKLTTDRMYPMKSRLDSKTLNDLMRI